MKKTIIALVVTALLITCLSGCGTDYPDVLTIDGEKVSMTEYNYFYNSMKLQADSNISPDKAEEYWETEKDGKTTYEILKEKAFDDLVDLRVAVKKAEKLGLTYDDNVLKMAGEIRKQIFQGAESESEFYKKTNTDSDTITRISKMIALRQSLLQKLMAEGEISITEEDTKKLFNESYLKAQHILFMTVDESNNPLPDEQKNEKKKKAEEILKRAKSGEDFTALMNEFSEDPGSKQQPEGYVFGEGEMVPEFENGTKALNPNEISGIVESSFGYHIIKRLPLSADENIESYNNAMQNLQSQVIANIMTEKVKEWKNEFEIVENKAPVDKLSYK